MINEIIAVLMELGLPLELAWKVVYKWKGAKHPTAIALRTDPWLRQVRDQYARRADGRLSPSSVLCVCPRNYIKGVGFYWESGHYHRYVTPRVWPLVSSLSRAWLERVNGPSEKPFAVTTVRCNRSVLCMRYFRHTMSSVDARIGISEALDRGGYCGADCVTNEDNSLATWLRYAPLNALEKYLKGVSGWRIDRVNLASKGKSEVMRALCMQF